MSAVFAVCCTLFTSNDTTTADRRWQLL